MLRTLLFILFSGFFISVRSQTAVIDKLRTELLQSNSPQKTLQILFSLCDERQSLHNDSLVSYAARALQLATASGNKDLVARAEYYVNNGLLKQGNYEEVIKNCDRLLKQDGLEPSTILSIMHLESVAWNRGERYKNAIALSFKFLQKAEALNDTLMQVKAKNTIGWAYMEMGQHANAISWFRKALYTTNNNRILQQYPVLFNNISSSYNNISMYDSALYFVNKSLNSGIENDLTSLANAMNIKADIYINLHKPQQAQYLLEQALAIRRRIGDPYYIVSDLYQLSVFYATNNQPQQGIKTSLQGIEEAKRFGLNSKIPLLYSGLAENYKAAGDMNTYARVLEDIIRQKDTLFQENSAKELAGLQARYDVQKKENIIIQQKLDIVRRDYLITGTVLLLIVIILLFLFIYNFYRNKQQQKFKRLVEQQKLQEMKAIMEAEEQQRKHIAAELHDNLGAQISFISSNIDWIIDAPSTLSEAEQKKRLQIIHNTSQGLMRTLRETIWALNREKIGLEEFSDKLKAYIQTFLQFQPNMHFHAHEAISADLVLKPVQALNIFRIFQEAVNNAIKYSKALNLSLNVEAVQNNFEINLKDDGIGFSPDAISGDHFGLQIMQQRASETGFAFSVLSASGSGTSITLSGAIND